MIFPIFSTPHHMNENLKTLANKFNFTDLNIEDMNPNFELMLQTLVMKCANMAQDESREAILQHFGMEEAQSKKLVPFAEFLTDLTPVRGDVRPIQLDSNHEHHQIATPENQGDDNNLFPAYHFTPEAYDLIEEVSQQFRDKMGYQNEAIDDRLLEICVGKTVLKCIELKQNNMSDDSLKSYFWDK